MKIFAFIKKEKADIELVDAKLAKFESIFNGMVAMSKFSKRLFEVFKARLGAVKEKLESMAENKTVDAFVEPGKVKEQVERDSADRETRQYHRGLLQVH